MGRLMRRTVIGAALGGLLGLHSAAKAAEQAAASAVTGQTAWDFSFDDIIGNPMPLADFKGKALLVVNTASFCGFTSQYGGLQTLHETYADRGLVVIGVPSSDFGNQEFGTDAEVKEFCDANFSVSFPLTSRQHVRGPQAHPFYQWVLAELGDRARPRWNFHKYLVQPDGRVTAFFSSFTAPSNARFIQAVEAALPKQ